MFDQSNTLPKRILFVFKTEGLKGLSKRIKNRLRPYQCHAFVLSFQSGPVSDPSAFPTGLNLVVIRTLERGQHLLNGLEFKQLTAADIGEIDELTEIDPFKVPKSVTLEKLQDGWLCYVAKYQGRIVASGWKKTGPEFYEPFFKRSLTLADDEVYGWRAFCMPAFRGRGVLPWLDNRIANHLALTAGVKNHVAYVTLDNSAARRTFVAIGWSVVGRLGFIEAFGFRIHYLWGHRAFSATRKRFFIQLQKRSDNKR